MDTCGHRFPAYKDNSTAHFEELSIAATFPTPTVEAALQADNSAVFPVAMKTSIMPLEPEDFTYATVADGVNTVFRLTLSNFDEELYSFAVWGRVFSTDGLDADPPIDETNLVDETTTSAENSEVESTDAAEHTVLSSILLVSIIVRILLDR